MKQDNTNHDNTQHNIEIDFIAIDKRGKQMASLLNEHANRLSMRTLKQLENGRARALQAHAQQSTGMQINSDGTLSNIFSWAGQHRMFSTGLILAALIAGFAVMQAFSHQESSDAFLLSADLPPEAFVDVGFEPTLNGSQHKNI
jgi:Protein of unknown function (DUF3619)